MQKINKTKLSKDDKLFIISFMAYPLILFAVFYVYANFSSILLAFRQYNFDETYNWVLFDNFKDFIELISGFSDRWTIGFQNSLKMYIICLVICLPLYILLSYILYKKCFMHRVLRVIVMVPQIISGFIMCLVFKNFVEGAVPEAMKILFGMQDFTNLLTDPDYTFGTTLFYTIWISFSTSLIVYPNAMNEISDEVIEAAKLDGVGNIFQELWYILIPLIFPTISTFLITGFSAIFTNAGSIPTFFMFDAPTNSVNIGYLYWVEIANSNTFSGYPMLAAGGIIMTAIVAPLTLLIKWALERFGPEADL